MTLSTTLKTISLLLLAVRQVYWFITEYVSHRKKKKTLPWTAAMVIKRVVSGVFSLLLLTQMLGLSLFPFSAPFWVEILGFAFVALSVAVSIAARITIGHNWSHAAEYQIKEGHTLVRGGIYSAIRHPIYLAVILSTLGVELQVRSLLVVLFTSLVFLALYEQGKREERLLIGTFGKKYRNYMNKTSMFVPFVV